MVGGAKIQCLAVVCDSFLQILDLSTLVKAGGNGLAKVMEGLGAMRVAGRAKVESLTVIYDGDLQILHLSQPLKASEQVCRHDVQCIRSELKSNVLLLRSNYTIQEVVTKRRFLFVTNPSANAASVFFWTSHPRHEF